MTPEELPIENWPKTRILPASYGNRLMTDFSVIGRESVKNDDVICEQSKYTNLVNKMCFLSVFMYYKGVIY